VSSSSFFLFYREICSFSGFSFFRNIRSSITETSQIRKAIATENALDETVLRGPAVGGIRKILPRSNLRYPFPKLPEYSDLKKLPNVREIIDLDRVVVVTGFGEVGPWGNSRTRWEIEAYGEFSLEGCIEMAWLMGFIKVVFLLLGLLFVFFFF